MARKKRTPKKKSVLYTRRSWVPTCPECWQPANEVTAHFDTGKADLHVHWNGPHTETCSRKSSAGAEGMYQ